MISAFPRAISTLSPPLTDEQRHAWHDTLTRKNLAGGPTAPRVSTAEAVPSRNVSTLAAVHETAAETLAETTLVDVSLTETAPESISSSSPMMNNSI
jgi:hypothetical protein